MAVLGFGGHFLCGCIGSSAKPYFGIGKFLLQICEKVLVVGGIVGLVSLSKCREPCFKFCLGVVGVFAAECLPCVLYGDCNFLGAVDIVGTGYLCLLAVDGGIDLR